MQATALAPWLTRWVVDRQHRRNLAQRRALGPYHGVPLQTWGAAVSAQGHLLLGGCDLVALAAEFGTPLTVVDRARLATAFQSFHGAFAVAWPRVAVAYSYKTNPLPGVLAVLHELGALAEASSHFELWLARKLGVPPDRIVLDGPGKGAEAIACAAAEGVRLINLDHLDEIAFAARAARGAGRRQDVGLRVVTSVGWSAQFGLPIASGAAFEAFRRIVQEPDLRPVALHAHLGTGIEQATAHARALAEMIDFARVLRRELGVAIDTFDVGGGFGVPSVRFFDRWDERLMRHGRPPAPVDAAAAPVPADHARLLGACLRASFPADDPAAPRLLLEPGRALTSAAQCLLLRVLAVKPRARDLPAVILDGGRNVAGPTAYESHELLPVNRAARPLAHSFDFFGPLCHPGDRLFTARAFPAVEPGDLVAVMDAGAYFVPNQTNFSHPRPAVVMVDGGQPTLLRRRETFDDIVARDRFA